MALTICTRCAGTGKLPRRFFWPRQCPVCAGTGRSRCSCGELRQPGSRFCSDECEVASRRAAGALLVIGRARF